MEEAFYIWKRANEVRKKCQGIHAWVVVPDILFHSLFETFNLIRQLFSVLPLIYVSVLFFRYAYFVYHEIPSYSGKYIL